MKLRFIVLTSRDMQARVIEEARSGQAGAPTSSGPRPWTPRLKLINDGYAQTYDSPEARNLPALGAVARPGVSA
ncbi:hypothetical protein ACRAWD_30885 [Caulobacter segnis]